MKEKLWKELSEEEKEVLIRKNDEGELKAIQCGIERYQKTMLAVQDDPLSKTPEKVAIAHFLQALRDRIRKLQIAIMQGNSNPWKEVILSIKAEKLSLLTLSHMFKGSRQVGSVLYREIADSILSELMLEEIKLKNKKKGRKEKGFTRSSDKTLQRKLQKIKGIYKGLGGEDLKWCLKNKIGLGAELCKCAIEATGGWHVQMEWPKKNISKAYIYMTDDLCTWLQSYHSDLQGVRPLKVPMCCPPLEWRFVKKDGESAQKPTASIRGGFRVLGTPLVTGLRHGRSANFALNTMYMPLETISHLQNTQWKIDEKILNFLEEVLKRGDPQWNNIIPVGGKPPKSSKPPEDRAARRIWHAHREQERARWFSMTSARISALKAIDTAREMVGGPVFFPWNFDFRGRMYPCSSYIHPQGNDLQKSLLLFAEGKPLGSNGLEVLKVNAATLAGKDKISYAERIQWFDREWLPQIRVSSPFDPWSNPVWADYDSPLLFLQCLWEIQRAILSDRVEDFISHLPVCVDGSQNGLQHLSALMRDEVGGKSVNLIDSNEPSDLYGDVAQKVREAIDDDCKKDPSGCDDFGNPLPHRIWKVVFEDKKKRRSVVKRSVMAFPYGISSRGIYDSVIADGHCEGLSGSIHNNALYIAEKIGEAVKGTVVIAAQLMDWFRDVARQVSGDGHSLQWTSPLGFPVLQCYIKEEMQVVNTCLHSVAFYIEGKEKKINSAQQVRGIVANYIHSLDASHLAYVILELKDRKINSIQAVHDSIGVHACHVGELHEIIRKKFITMHDQDLLGSFIREVQTSTGIKLEPPPLRGKLNLDSVMKSRFFFS